jgi:hypothetical protein
MLFIQRVPMVSSSEFRIFLDNTVVGKERFGSQLFRNCFFRREWQKSLFFGAVETGALPSNSLGQILCLINSIR